MFSSPQQKKSHLFVRILARNVYERLEEMSFGTMHYFCITLRKNYVMRVRVPFI